MTLNALTSSSRFVRIAVLFAVGVLISIGAEAGPRRARMSRDLSERIASGRREVARVIVKGDAARVQAIAARHGGRITRQLGTAAVVEFSGDRLEAVSQDADVEHLSGDVPVRRMMSVTPQAIGADQVWAGAFEGVRGYKGRGIGVAVIDSGVAAHPSIRRRIVASVDFTGERSKVADAFGHGTHVAGIIAGADDTGYAGVAPGAHIVSLKVLKSDGSGNTSDVIAAIEWAIANRAAYNLRVINLSLGHPVFESYQDDPLCQAVRRATDAGLLVVAAAGNFGKTEDGRAVVGGIVSPGNSPAALTVGASNTRGTIQRSDDVMATYSSRGPTAIDGLLKPELTAPGNRIVAASAPGSYLARTYPERVVGTARDAYIEMSGTSMAAAVVSGAAALVLEANPRLRPAEVKLALQVTSSRVPGAGLIEAGAGQLNAVAAVGLVRGRRSSTTTVIALEAVNSQGIAFCSSARASQLTTASCAIPGNAVQPAAAATIVPGDTIVWGDAFASGDTIVWGDTIIWGDGIVWGNASNSGDTIVWGDAINSGDTIVWGDAVASGDTIVWGDAFASGDTIVWGDAFASGDTIVWGDAFASGDTIVWGD